MGFVPLPTVGREGRWRGTVRLPESNGDGDGVRPEETVGVLISKDERTQCPLIVRDWEPTRTKTAEVDNWGSPRKR